jgi:transcriptional regulator with XRE-family HTH domain
MKLCEAISYARECKGLTLRELERLTGISNALLSQMETGVVKEPSFRNIVKLSKALGISLSKLANAE